MMITINAAAAFRPAADPDDLAAWAAAAARLRALAIRIEEAQRFAVYAQLYNAMAAYHLIHCHERERVLQCFQDAQRCHARAVAIVFGPCPELV